MAIRITTAHSFSLCVGVICLLFFVQYLVQEGIVSSDDEEEMKGLVTSVRKGRGGDASTPDVYKGADASVVAMVELEKSIRRKSKKDRLGKMGKMGDNGEEVGHGHSAEEEEEGEGEEEEDEEEEEVEEEEEEEEWEEEEEDIGVDSSSLGIRQWREEDLLSDNDGDVGGVVSGDIGVSGVQRRQSKRKKKKTSGTTTGGIEEKRPKSRGRKSRSKQKKAKKRVTQKKKKKKKKKQKRKRKRKSNYGTLYFYSSISVDFSSNIIPHFLLHYINQGIPRDNMLLLLHSKLPKHSLEIRTVQRYLRSAGVREIHILSGSYTSDTLDVMRNRILDAFVPPTDSWIVMASTDEFHTYGKSLMEYIHDVQDAGATAVIGKYFDRFSEDCLLVSVNEDPSVWKQFPRKRLRMMSPTSARGIGIGPVDPNLKRRNLNGKIIIYRGYLRPDTFEEDVDMRYQEYTHYHDHEPYIHHFQWHDQLIPMLEERVKRERQVRFGWSLPQQLLNDIRSMGVKRLCEEED